MTEKKKIKVEKERIGSKREGRGENPKKKGRLLEEK